MRCRGAPNSAAPIRDRHFSGSSGRGGHRGPEEIYRLTLPDPGPDSGADLRSGRPAGRVAGRDGRSTTLRNTRAV